MAFVADLKWRQQQASLILRILYLTIVFSPDISYKSITFFAQSSFRCMCTFQNLRLKFRLGDLLDLDIIIKKRTKHK